MNKSHIGPKAIISTLAALALVCEAAFTPASTTPERTDLRTTISASLPTDTLSVGRDTILTSPRQFEDESLESVMKSIERAYKVRVIFRSKATAALRMYYLLDPALPLDDIIAQLNTFEQINIVRSGNTITID